MNDTQPFAGVRPDVEQFVSAVRSHFADLDPDERDELLGGLEADVTDRVAEEGGGLLGDPAAYAAELRAAAGLPASSARRRGGGLSAMSPTDAVEATRNRFDAFVSRHGWAGRVMEFLTAIRPAWWVFRGWLVVQLVDLFAGPWEDITIVPSLMVPGLGLLLTVAAVVVSVQVGRGVWPSSERPNERPNERPSERPSERLGAPRRRLLVLAGNLAVLFVALPLTADYAQRTVWSGPYVNAAYAPAGLTMGGRPVCNIAAYDVNGQPLTGVQLFDQRGRALNPGLDCLDDRVQQFPWLLGDVERHNVYPQAERRGWGRGRASAYDSEQPPAFPVNERATVPAVTHPLANATTAEAAGAVIFDGEEVCTIRVETKDGKRLKDVRVIDVTGERRLPMNTPDC